MPEDRAGTGKGPGERQRHIPDRPEEPVPTTSPEQWPKRTVKRLGVLQEDKIIGEEIQVNGSPKHSDGQNEKPEDGGNIPSAKSSV